ncbi:IclR family transcriptional regulator [Bradyrhizobium archetypum]|uniref:IclR family transcriptional regulator n=1 Tax=Bradyrhizobium archetypum TaxID=2721160 RepID=A0A7Y4M112_9BRAD|nr:IclR family transcriptional regulator [Bradyrhizobium archetypum]NOJ45961.1 IclR family transcriptional regulator [Bradyrhizobium archetypum]
MPKATSRALKPRSSEPRPEDERISNGIQVLARAGKILRTLESHPNGLSLGQIAKSVNLARSTVQRIVAALIAEDFLTSTGPGEVRIGMGLLRIAASVGANSTDIIRPHLIALGEDVGETVDLSVLSGGSAVFVDQIPGRHRLTALSAVGERFPLHCTANGKAVLACFSPEESSELIEKSLAEHPDFPLANRKRLMDELSDIRRTHLAYDLEEHGTGISAIGTAVIDHFGRPVAVSIPVPTQRFLEHRDGLAERLLGFRRRVEGVLSR